MARIAGLTLEKTVTGKIKKVTIDMNKWGHLLEDTLDAIAAEAARKRGDFEDWDTVKKSLEPKLKAANNV